MKTKLLLLSFMFLVACAPVAPEEICVEIMVTSIPTPTRQPDIGGVYLGDGRFDCDSERNCLHELGHATDEWGGFPSSTEEFRQAVDKYIEENRKPFLECHREMVCRIQNFPGIAGNPMREIELIQEDGSTVIGYWGGYGEVYADIYAQWKTWSPLPEELRDFYFWAGVQ